MKYIRTKDGKIIKILKEGIDEFGKYGMVDEENCIRNYDDLKQADTIEELCDMLVYNQIPVKKTDSMFEEIRRYYKTRYEKDLYGAIWTDKGLIYVAKMNNKGELELL